MQDQSVESVYRNVVHKYALFFIVSVKSLWAAEGGEGAWNLVPSQSKLRHIIWNKLDTTLRNQH